MFKLCTLCLSGLPLESTGFVQGALNGTADALATAGRAARRCRTYLTLQRALRRH